MKSKIALVIIVIVAAGLRLWKLDTIPALNADEAAIGYNAYSLLLTGKDEHGESWPIHFKSFNDYKPGLYFYVDLPFIAALGLTETAVRLPNALAGIGSVLIMYFLANELSVRIFNKHYKSKLIGLIGAAFLAISPWHIHYSRGGWEANFATFLVTVGVYLLIKSKSNLKLITLSFIFFVLSMYCYHSARVISPLIVLFWLVSNISIIKSNLKTFGIAVLMSALLVLPLVIQFIGPAGLSRASGVGLFADKGPIARIDEQRNEGGNNIFEKVIHNKPINYGLTFLSNWSSHYWGEFLFLSGDVIQRNRVPETGQVYLWLGIFVVIGLFSIFREKMKDWSIILYWLAVAPMAAALTFQSPHALRSENMVIPLTLISSVGLCYVYYYLGHKSKFATNLFIICFGIVSSISFLRYEHMYWLHMAKEYPFSSQYGVKELVNYVGSVKENYKNIIVTDRYDQPYILFLFYMKYPPGRFQTDHVLTPPDGFGFSTVREFDKYKFYSIKLDSMKKDYPKSLIIGSPEEIPDGNNVIKNIYGSNGYNYFKVIAN